MIFSKSELFVFPDRKRISAFQLLTKILSATSRRTLSGISHARQLNVFNLTEKILKDVNERMLEAVGVKFGKDSDEYEKAGGVRKSERKKPVKKAKP